MASSMSVRRGRGHLGGGGRHGGGGGACTAAQAFCWGKDNAMRTPEMETESTQSGAVSKALRPLTPKRFATITDNQQ